MNANVWFLTAFIGRWRKRKHFKPFQCKKKRRFIMIIIIIYVFTDALRVAACWAERVNNSVSVEGRGRWNSTCFGQWEWNDVENGGCVCVCLTDRLRSHCSATLVNRQYLYNWILLMSSRTELISEDQLWRGSVTNYFHACASADTRGCNKQARFIWKSFPNKVCFRKQKTKRGKKEKKRKKTQCGN